MHEIAMQLTNPCLSMLPLCLCSLRTTLCVRFKGSVVACGIMFYTSRRLKVGDS